MKLLTPQEETVNVTRHGALLYLTPSIVAYDETVMNPYERALDEYMNTLGVDPNCAGIPQHDTSTDAVDQLKVLINVIQPWTHYHTDYWQLDEAGGTLTRIHKRPRRLMFMPNRSDCPVPLNRPSGTRVATLDFGEGRVESWNCHWEIQQTDQPGRNEERTLERQNRFFTWSFNHHWNEHILRRDDISGTWDGWSWDSRNWQTAKQHWQCSALTPTQYRRCYKYYCKNWDDEEFRVYY